MIPVCEPSVTNQDIELVNDCLRSGWISSAGRYIDEFENCWASYCGMPFGISVSSGTAALQIAVELLDLEPGDEVIVPTFSIISVAQAVVRCGGVPVLVDSNPDDWQMNVGQVASRVTARTRAIIVVHTYGHPADMWPIQQLARQHNLQLIEDAAEAHGAEYRGQKCGSLGDISVFSFYANKLVSTGEGGMVLVRDPQQAERVRQLRNLCFGRQRRFQHARLGHNFRLTNLQAALGVSQMRRIDDTIARKRMIASRYKQDLHGLPNLTGPCEQSWARSVYWVCGFLVDDTRGPGADEVRRRLAQRGIESRPFFWNMHEQPVFQQMGLFHNERYPVAERLARQGLYLPNGMTLTDEQIREVSHHVKVCLQPAQATNPETPQCLPSA